MQVNFQSRNRSSSFCPSNTQTIFGDIFCVSCWLLYQHFGIIPSAIQTHKYLNCIFCKYLMKLRTILPIQSTSALLKILAMHTEVKYSKVHTWLVWKLCQTIQFDTFIYCNCTRFCYQCKYKAMYIPFHNTSTIDILYTSNHIIQKSYINKGIMALL